MLFAEPICALELGAVSPLLDAVPLLHVLKPLAFVAGTVLVHELTIALGSVLDPFAVVRITVHVRELPSPMGFVRDELAFVPAPIETFQDTLAFSNGAFPLTSVLDTSFQKNGTCVNLLTSVQPPTAAAMDFIACVPCNNGLQVVSRLFHLFALEARAAVPHDEAGGLGTLVVRPWRT